ncbi:uncharacterized protein SOCEGT47_055260 [Sorangium cellulosum]|uniref:Protein kinase domain-containing protein n=1 Tax=Sorangium cellulosum TaxID=56 RepID=A0A4P2Q6D0_SORCE|nr:serine/threonine-protein kinase [Sorangium cellulosum]AUX24985.1 uncharacterized protein SOCEGT47_055260 [Sorangium cellulosum]
MSHGEHGDTDDGSQRAAPPAPYAPGSVVAGHRLVRVLGTGGLGAVYEAVHEFTQRRVALKLLLPSYASSAQARERARKEAIALCRLRHKNIVSVHSADTLPDGTVWMAMELLEGQSLRRICQVESPLSVARGLHLGIEIADGLAAAHDLGIVHRDVKPENVFLDRHGDVKLLDLNIAKIQVDGLPSTRPGQRFGTTAYMAPEECYGDPCTPASDVYSLMLVIYELLAGRYVFATGRGLSGIPSEGQLVAAHLFWMPVPLHEVTPSIPAYFWPVFQLGLAKQPAARFRHAGAAASALRELRERYFSDARAGRLAVEQAEQAEQAEQDAGQPGSRREHHGPRSPERLITAPMPAETRVILAGLAASADPGEAEACEEGAATGARPAQPSVAPSHPPPSAAPAAEPGWPLAMTPGPVTVRSSPGDRGSVPPAPGLPPTDRVADRRRRALLLRRCLAAAVLAIPISGAVTALYIHARRERPAAAASAGEVAAAASAPHASSTAVATVRAEPALPGARETRETGAPPGVAPAHAAQATAPAPGPEEAEAEAPEAAPSPRTAASAGGAGAPARESAGAPARESAGAPARESAGGAGAPARASAPATRARPGAGAARAPAPHAWDWLSSDIYEDDEDIYPMPSRGRAAAPAKPARPRRAVDGEPPFGSKPIF